LTVLGKYTTLRPYYKHYIGKCPMHEDSGESLQVYPGRGLYHCFGCGLGGSPITAIMELEDKGFTEAVEFLYDQYIKQPENA